MKRESWDLIGKFNRFERTFDIEWFSDGECQAIVVYRFILLPDAPKHITREYDIPLERDPEYDPLEWSALELAEALRREGLWVDPKLIAYLRSKELEDKVWRSRFLFLRGRELMQEHWSNLRQLETYWGIVGPILGEE